MKPPDAAFDFSLVRIAATGNLPATSAARRLAQLLLQLVHHVREDAQTLIRKVIGVVVFQLFMVPAFIDRIVSKNVQVSREVASYLFPRLPRGNVHGAIVIGLGQDRSSIANRLPFLAPAQVHRQFAVRAFSQRRSARTLFPGIVAI